MVLAIGKALQEETRHHQLRPDLSSGIPPQG
jgi:hypothetical protein